MAGSHTRSGWRRSTLWTDALGRASIRAGQLIVLLAAAVIVAYGLIRLKLIVIPLMIALILAAALHPVVRYLHRHGVRGSVGRYGLNCRAGDGMMPWEVRWFPTLNTLSPIGSAEPTSFARAAGSSCCSRPAAPRFR